MIQGIVAFLFVAALVVGIVEHVAWQWAMRSESNRRDREVAK